VAVVAPNLLASVDAVNVLAAGRDLNEATGDRLPLVTLELHGMRFRQKREAESPKTCCSPARPDINEIKMK